MKRDPHFIKRFKSCINKVRYEDQIEAENAIISQKPRYLRWYYCGLCAGYHLSSKENKNVRSS